MNVEAVGSMLHLTVMVVALQPPHIIGTGATLFSRDETPWSDVVDVAISQALGTPAKDTSRERVDLHLGRGAPPKLGSLGRRKVVVLVNETPCGKPPPIGVFARILEQRLSAGLDVLAAPLFDADVAKRSPDELRAEVRHAGAELVVFGEAACNDTGPILGTQMHSIRAEGAARLVDVATNAVLASGRESVAVGHIDTVAGGASAFEKLAKKIVFTWLGARPGQP
jgi:hypothetical protein